MTLLERLAPRRWAATQTPIALMVIRLLLLANTGVLAAAGTICLLFYSRPAAFVAAGVLWSLAAGLLVLVPYTDARRGTNRRW